MPKLHELTGQITGKELRKVYDKKSPYHGNIHYKLQLAIENKKKEESLFVYPNLASQKIFQTIEQSQYIDKRYLLFCGKKAKGWVLHDWKELTPSPTEAKELPIIKESSSQDQLESHEKK